MSIVERMVLNDWKGGKLPFNVCPSDSEEPLEENEAGDGGLAVVQDFRKIKAGFSYEGDDKKELAAIKHVEKVCTPLRAVKSNRSSDFTNHIGLWRKMAKYHGKTKKERDKFKIKLRYASSKTRYK